MAEGYKGTRSGPPEKPNPSMMERFGPGRSSRLALSSTASPLGERSTERSPQTTKSAGLTTHRVGELFIGIGRRVLSVSSETADFFGQYGIKVKLPTNHYELLVGNHFLQKENLGDAMALWERFKDSPFYDEEVHGANYSVELEGLTLKHRKIWRTVAGGVLIRDDTAPFYTSQDLSMDYARWTSKVPVGWPHVQPESWPPGLLEKILAESEEGLPNGEALLGPLGVQRLGQSVEAPPPQQP